MGYVKIEELQVEKVLYNFINNEVIPSSNVEKNSFWQKFSKLVHDLSPKNSLLLKKRLDLQAKINEWHITNRKTDVAMKTYKKFLADIGYLIPEGPDFSIGTENVDDEIATIAGPQLVVPVSNARYALNAANARWGSLYDALYGTDAIVNTSELNQNGDFDFSRGQKVISSVRKFLDEVIPLKSGFHSEAIKYSIKNGELIITQIDKSQSQLINPKQFRGYLGNPNTPSSVILWNNGLHIEIQINSEHFIGETDTAGISDVILESALTTIVDFEDSIAAVDAADKVDCYRNWLGLMLGTLNTPVEKAGKKIKRQLNPDKIFIEANGNTSKLPGRSLMLVRNVGHLMFTDSVLDKNSTQIPEGILDAVITSLIATIDLNRHGTFINSQAGSIYIVKPKMHGPEEVAFADELFSRVENLLDLDANTIKMGIMDEERRTTINLKECIRSASNRVAFINTGFLDRTGDEIFTSMEAGPVVQKNAIKVKPWIQAYENWNVDNGLRCGLQGRAQIGKGMWAMPDMMSAMIKTKINHPQEGANTAWVPSPTAATLHSMHYHKVDVFARQNELKNRERANLDDILTIPLAQSLEWTKDEIQNELNNNAQGILGYVVRWVDQGIGCSKVPDIDNIGLMEDRATLRISSQHIANWLHHQICSEDQVMETMKRMARIVDQQNENDPEYVRMSTDYDASISFQAACDLVLKGRYQPSGYTEPILHARRREVKQKKINLCQ